MPCLEDLIQTSQTTHCHQHGCLCVNSQAGNAVLLERALMSQLSLTFTFMWPATNLTFLWPAINLTFMWPAVNLTFMWPATNLTFMWPATNLTFMWPATNLTFMWPAIHLTFTGHAVNLTFTWPAAPGIFGKTEESFWFFLLKLPFHHHGKLDPSSTALQPQSTFDY